MGGLAVYDTALLWIDLFYLDEKYLQPCNVSMARPRLDGPQAADKVQPGLTIERATDESSFALFIYP